MQSGDIQRLVIGGHEWAVLFVAEIQHEGQVVYGLCDTDRHIISIAVRGRPTSHVREIVLHEIMHALWYTSFLWKVNRPDEELIVSHLSKQLNQVLSETHWLRNMYLQP